MNTALLLNRRCRSHFNPLRPAGRRGVGLFLVLSLLLLSAGPSARGELNKDEQAKVNDAIKKGVEFLKSQQFANGTFFSPKNDHLIGYATLPGLTLLESGVPANDPAIKRIAVLIRQQYRRVDGTYELALSILFLDRLGNPDDKKIIQTLALRLIAGQRATGGWSYKCPPLGPSDEKDLLTTLQRLPTLPPLFTDAQTGKINLGAEPVQVSINMPLLGTFSYKAPYDQVPPGSIAGSTGSSPGENGTGSDQSFLDSMSSLETASVHLSQQNRCIKSLEPVPPEATRVAKVDDKPGKPVVIPGRLRGLPIFIDLQRLVMIDDLNPEFKTDNSNTQFALLALWAAQRYDVPMDRTLRLLVRRFQVTQNANGGWDYWYFLGGGDNQANRGPGASPQMAAVGLLGMAVGHGLAAPNRGAGIRRQVQDPSIVKGFIALNQHIGRPTGRMEGHPQTNLYFLWSLERVAVLYNIDQIDGKDWYRWGAEILVANQQPAGNWKDGKYHGASPVIDTCLALLFLQRANLAKDLGDKLPFNPLELTTAVTDQARKDTEKKNGTEPIDEKKGSPMPEGSSPIIGPSPMTDPKMGTEEKKETKSNPESEKQTATDRASSPPAAVPEEKRKAWPYILLVVGTLLLLGAGVFLVIYLRGEGEEDEERPRSKKKSAKKSMRR